MVYEHYSKHYTCEACGYRKFHYGSEFKDGQATDKTKHCADCGHVNVSVIGTPINGKVAGNDDKKGSRPDCQTGEGSTT